MTSAPSLPAALQALADEAEQLVRHGQLDAAARAFERLRAAAPDYSRALAFFAMRAYSQGQLGTARELIERAAAGFPRTALVQAQRATILLAANERDAALAALLDALALDPEFVPARFDAAMLLEDLGRSREA